ncbi:MAG: tetratricopeptide repeat protein [Pirellulales bacterium]
MVHRCISALIAAITLAASSGSLHAQRVPPGAEQANVHNPFSPGYVDMRPDPAPSGSFFYFDGAGHGWIGAGHGRYGYPPGFWPPYYYHDYYYDPYFRGPIVYPPLVVPAETMYGPQALRRFMGVDQPPAAAPAPAPAIQAGQAAGGGFGVLAPAAPDPARPKRPPSNAEAVARSRQFITFGDEHFRQQKFANAYQRYKKAVAAAPDLADPWFRQGQTLLAMGRYDSAASALKRGLSLKPDWPRTAFRLDQLYGANQLAKTTHLEALARAATQKPDNADLMFLLGVQLYFDGQADRARNFFIRSRDLALDAGDHLFAFLKELPPPAEEL